MLPVKLLLSNMSANPGPMRTEEDSMRAMMQIQATMFLLVRL